MKYGNIFGKCNNAYEISYDSAKDKFYVRVSPLTDVNNANIKTFYGDYALEEFLRAEGLPDELIQEAVSNAVNDAYAQG